MVDICISVVCVCDYGRMLELDVWFAVHAKVGAFLLGLIEDEFFVKGDLGECPILNTIP